MNTQPEQHPDITTRLAGRFIHTATRSPLFFHRLYPSSTLRGCVRGKMMFETTSTTHSPDRPKPHRQRGGVCSLAEPFTGESHSSFARLRLAAPDIRRTCSRDTHTSSRPVPSVSFFASVRSSPYGRGAHGADRTVLGAPGCRSAIQRTRATR